LAIAVVVFGIGLLTGRPVLDVAVAAVATYALLLLGVVLLFGLAQPMPEPPPPGELRKVRLTYRCSICGTEVRMTAANDEDPEPPRHCLEDMDLVAPIE
jgi:hypothetical protein